MRISEKEMEKILRMFALDFDKWFENCFENGLTRETISLDLVRSFCQEWIQENLIRETISLDLVRSFCQEWIQENLKGKMKENARDP